MINSWHLSCWIFVLISFGTLCLTNEQNSDNKFQVADKLEVFSVQPNPEFKDGKLHEIDREPKLRHRRSNKNDEKEFKRGKSKKKEGRRKIAISLVEKIVEEKLKEQLDPLATALKIVRLDAFSEGILRQLTNMEHIQSKLLTEFGELRAAVHEVGRHTLDLGRQVVGLDERLTAFGRQLPHRLDFTGARNDYRSDSNSRSANLPYSEMSQTTEILKDALLSITTKISGTERRFKEDLFNLGNHTSEAIKASQSILERRIAEVALDTGRLLVSVEKLGNKTSCQTMSSTPLTGSLSSDRFFRRPSALTQSSSHKLNSPEGIRDDLVYLPAENPTIRREERQHPPSITPFTSWMPSVSEVHSMSPSSMSRFASEIAKKIVSEGNDIARDCSDIASSGERRSGVYTIYPASCTRRYIVEVWCELEEATGGWTVIQNRGEIQSSSSLPVLPMNFFRDWVEYKWGFGDLREEFWLGNEYIHQITNSGDYDLRIELHDWSAESRWAEYSHFYIDNESKNYTLHFGEYSGNAGNSLKHHQGVAFSTRDRDNDANPKGHCARTFHGAWWFTSCHESHLNGRYTRGGRHKSYGEGINWLAFKGHNYSLKKSRMMIRPSRTNS